MSTRVDINLGTSAGIHCREDGTQDRPCKDGHQFTIRSVRGHDDWHCVVCSFIPGTRAVLSAYVEKHGGRIVL